jgi:hypothetical protein
MVQIMHNLNMQFSLACRYFSVLGPPFFSAPYFQASHWFPLNEGDQVSHL